MDMQCVLCSVGTEVLYNINEVRALMAYPPLTFPQLHVRGRWMLGEGKTSKKRVSSVQEGYSRRRELLQIRRIKINC